MKKVLVTGGYNIGRAGVATIVYRWGQNFDNSVLTCDYLMAKGLPDKKYIDAIESKGGHIIAPDTPLSLIKKLVWIFNSMIKGQYDLVHINIDVAYKAMVYILLARLAGIDKIALHSHCSFIDDDNVYIRGLKTILHYLTRGYCRNSSKILLACSKEAAEWMFGKQVVMENQYIKIFNGLEVEDYRYNEDLRIQYRKQFGIAQDEIVICNIGRFSYQKNHKFLIDVFEKFHQKNPHSRLILIGTGNLEKEIKEYVYLKKLSERVMFLGRRMDVNQLLSMMDVFVLTSRFEGLPLVLVEAQAAALPCIVSDKVSKESGIIEYVDFLPLKEPDVWVSHIEKCSKIKRKDIDCSGLNEYEIRSNAEMLQSILG